MTERADSASRKWIPNPAVSSETLTLYRVCFPMEKDMNVEQNGLCFMELQLEITVP